MAPVVALHDAPEHLLIDLVLGDRAASFACKYFQESKLSTRQIDDVAVDGGLSSAGVDCQRSGFDGGNGRGHVGCSAQYRVETR